MDYAMFESETIADHECSNCYEMAERLVTPAYFLLPKIDLSEACEGDIIEAVVDGGRGKTIICRVVIIDKDPFLRVVDSRDDPVCVKCYTHAVWPSLYPFLQGKPKQIKLDGWADPEWVEIEIGS